MKKIKFLLPIILALIGFIVWKNYPKLNLISGYSAKNMASNHFIANRALLDIQEKDNDMPFVKLASLEEANSSSVISSVYGLMPRESIYREGLGCILITDDYDKSQKLLQPKRSTLLNERPFPFGNAGRKDTVFDNINYDQVNQAVANAFDNYKTQKTRTVLIAYKNEIIAENYSKGFTKETPILGWSMTKSVLATLYGIFEQQGKISMDYQPFGEDIRMKKTKIGITLDHLLRMQSGLAWEEDYTKISDVTQMLFLDTDMTLAQVKKQPIALPTEIWNYSSGTTNLLSGILRDQFQTHQDYLDFPYTDLIDKIGMHSMLLETDMDGNFVGSSYGWANTRDWAKFGLLYLNKGMWNGERLFSEDWVDYITKPTAHSDGVYGAHFWLNSGGKFPDVPRDMYSANGFQGQYVFVIPSKYLVVVRTGLAEDPEFDVNKFLSEICAAVK
ncbi:MAG: CubicO group peptidase (beta-lactamase class C family) [Maribacter sp.]